MEPTWRVKATPLYGPDRTVADWHTPPPPDPIFARRVRSLRWEKLAVVTLGLAIFGPIAVLGFKFHLTGLLNLLNPYLLLTGWVWTRRPPVSVRHLMDLPPAPGQFPVRVTYSANKFSYGSDAGVATIEGSWITFQGLESEFAFQRHQAEVVTHPYSRTVNTENLQINFRESGKQYHIGIRPYDQVEGVGQGYRKSFCAKASFWSGLIDKATGEPTLPPLAPKAMTLDSARRTYRLFFIPPILPILAFLIWNGTHGYGDYWTCGLIACLCLSFLFSLLPYLISKRIAFLQLLLNPPERPTPAKIAIPAVAEDERARLRLEETERDIWVRF